MSFASRLGLLALGACACLAVYQWKLVTDNPRDLTRAALQQFENSDTAAQELRVADAAKHWWVLGGVAGLVLLTVILFRENVERWWWRLKSETRIPKSEPNPNGKEPKTETSGCPT